LGVGRRVDDAAAHGQQHLQRTAFGPGAGLREVGAGQGVAGGAFGVDDIGFGPAAAGEPVKWSV